MAVDWICQFVKIVDKSKSIFLLETDTIVFKDIENITKRYIKIYLNVVLH